MYVQLYVEMYRKLCQGVLGKWGDQRQSQISALMLALFWTGLRAHQAAGSPASGDSPSLAPSPPQVCCGYRC